MNALTSKIAASVLMRRLSLVVAGDIVSKSFAVWTAVLLIRALDTKAYAAYIIYYSVTVTMPVLVGSGLNLSLVRSSSEKLSGDQSTPIELYMASVIVQILAYSVILALAFPFAPWLGKALFGSADSYTTSLRCGLLAGFGIMLIEACRSIYQAEERFRSYSSIMCWRQFSIFVSVVVLMMLNRFSFESCARSFVVIEIGIGIILTTRMFLSRRLAALLSHLRSRSQQIKVFLKASAWLVLYAVLLSLFQRIDMVMLSHIGTESELASYGVAFRLYSLALVVLGPIHTVLLPKLCRTDMLHPAVQRRFAIDWIRCTGWVCIPVAVFDTFGRPLFALVTGPHYTGTFNVLTVFSIGVCSSIMLSPLVNIVLSRQAYRYLCSISLGALALNVASNSLLIPTYGAAGAAVSTVLAHALFNGAATLHVFFFDRKCKCAPPASNAREAARPGFARSGRQTATTWPRDISL